MAKDHRRTIAELILADMEVRTTDASGFYFNQKFADTRLLRIREIDIGDMTGSLFCFDNCFHVSYHLSIIGCGYTADVRYVWTNAEFQRSSQSYGAGDRDEVQPPASSVDDEVPPR